MGYLTDKKFWVAVFDRAIRTAAQTALSLIGTNNLGITDVDWLGVASGAGLASVISVLMSLSGLPETSVYQLGDSNDGNGDGKSSGAHMRNGGGSDA